MHELSICGSIADIVTRHANGRPVRAVHVRVGQLRQIVPDTLVYCWSLVSADTPLAGSRMEVERIGIRLACHGCAAETDAADFPLACAGCGGVDVDIVAGEEFLITSLELAEG